MKHWLLIFSFLLLGSFSFFSSVGGRSLDSEEEKETSSLPPSFLHTPPKQKSSCLSILKKVAFMAADKSSLLAVAALGAWGGSEWVGQQTNTPLVGLSIYLDYEEILNHLSANERALLQAKEKNTEEIVKVLTFRLSTKTEDKLHLWPYLNPLMASSYLGNNPPDANVCRHKALILRAVLNHLGIPAQLVTGTVKGDSGPGEHVWVFLPQLNKVADPMNNLVLPRTDYDKLFEVRENFGIIHFAKPVGIMVR